MSAGHFHPVSRRRGDSARTSDHGHEENRGTLLQGRRSGGRRHDDFSGHSHGDSQYRHVTRPGGSRSLLTALVLIGCFALVEFLGGLWSGSLALVADSGHMLTDTASLGFSLAAHIIAQRPASGRHSYGLARAEVIAAFVNSLALLAVVVWLVIEGIDRIAHPVPVNGQAVFVIASGGLLVNLLVAWILSRDRENLNIRAALLHVIGDLLGSVAALLAGLIIMNTGYTVVDPLLSMLVSGLILHSTFGVLRESTSVLLDSVPAGVDYQSVGKALATIPGVISVHDLHVWAMVPGHGAVSAHLLIERIERWPAILHQARQILDRDYDIDHVTLQPEWLGRAPGSASIPIQAKL
ncbi:Zinc transporter ZitB [Burkholderiales bacterium]|nr:Zinc transporter ZitB [Burkholderiales bacterium]